MRRTDSSRSRRAHRLVTALAAYLLAVGWVVAITPTIAHADGPTTFTNNTGISIPATGSANQIGPASPYPSTIAVSGMSGPVSKVTVTFNGLTHGTLGDVDAMVVAPDGSNLVVLSDLGATDTTNYLAKIKNQTLTFDDAATGPIPIPGAPNFEVSTGTFQPTRGTGSATFPAPAPVPSSATTLAGAFTGMASANGTWSLYVVDDSTGDAGEMAGGWSLTITTDVAAVSTAVTVASSDASALVGESVTFTASVTAAGAPVTDGTVQFMDGTTNLGAPVTLNASGSATLTTGSLAEGTHVIRAVYSGASGFLTQTGTVSQRVDHATVVTNNTFCNPGGIAGPGAGSAQPYPSNIFVSGLSGQIAAVTVSVNGLSHTSPADFDIMLSGPSGGPLVLLSDVGDINPVSDLDLTFDDAAATAVPVPPIDGTFRPTDLDPDGQVDTFPAPAPAPGDATTLATFAGIDANGTWSLWVVDDASADVGSISGGWCVTITSLAQTDVTLTMTPNPSGAGDTVTFRAAVTAGGTPVTGGTVAFTEGGSSLATVPVNGAGIAEFSSAGLGIGSHTIVATYSGTATYAGSSQNATQIVNALPSTTTIASSQNPSTDGDTVTFTASVSPQPAPGQGGTVDFSVDGTVICADVSVQVGALACSTAALAPGVHTVKASYSGAGNSGPSVGSLMQSVRPVATAGGPYDVAEGSGVTLGATAVSTGITAYGWDLDGDGDFGDATGATPTLTWEQLDSFGINDGQAAPTSYPITLRAFAGTAYADTTTTIVVTNTAPVAVLTGDTTATAGQAFTIKVGAQDPSSADMAAMFEYTVDWGDGSPLETVTGPVDPPVTHTYASQGDFRATFSATDKDGGQGAVTATDVSVAAAPTTTTTPPPTTTTPPPTAPSTTTSPGTTAPAGSAAPASPVVRGGGDGSTLATTGASPSGGLLLGGILVAAGGLILVMARRRTYRGLHE